jgi:hypothetical protein
MNYIKDDDLLSYCCLYAVACCQIGFESWTTTHGYIGEFACSTTCGGFTI